MIAKSAPLLLLLVGAFTGCERIWQGTGKSPASTPAEVEAVTDAGFDTFVRTPGKVVVVDFYADWCPPCRALGPRLEAAVAGFDSKVVLGKVDVDKQGALAQRHGVRSIPDVRIFRDGRQVDRFVGDLASDEIRKMLARHSAGLPESTPSAPAGTATQADPEPPIRPMEKDWRPPGIERR